MMVSALYLSFVISVISVPLISIQAQRQSYLQAHLRVYPSRELSVSPLGIRANSDTTLLPKSLATITTDTGDLAPGHRDFARYTDIRMCLAAAAITRDVLRHSLKARDNLEKVRETPERDTLPASVAVAARNCAARFTVAGTAAKDLPLLFDLALYAGNDSMAHSVLARLVTGAPTVADKQKILTSYAIRYLKAEPARVAAADSIEAQIDKLGEAGLGERIYIHDGLRDFYSTKHFNNRLVRREAEQVITLIQSMVAPEPPYMQTVSNAYRSLMLWAWLNYPDSIPVFAQRYQQYLGRPAVQSALKAGCVNDKKVESICNLASAPLETVIGATLPVGMYQSKQQPVAPPVRADFWFPAPGRDTVQPAPGMVSVILHTYIDNCVTAPGSCRDWIDRVRRLGERCKSAEVPVTIVLDVPGYRLGGNPGPADSVAQSYRLYLQDYFKWPVNVAVRTMQVIYSLPSPDGRKFYGRTKYRDVYDSNGVVMTDRAGKVIYSSGDNGRLDINIDQLPPFEFFVEHAISASKQAVGTVPSSPPSSSKK
jgi:hypothetical protein